MPPDPGTTAPTGAVHSRRPATSAAGDVIEIRPSALSTGPEGTGGEVAAALTTRIVGLLREHTGRGPTKAKAMISADVIVVSLADCLTTSERRLVSTGDAELVGRGRDALLRGLRDEASAIVETLTRCQVRAYLTARGPDDDLAVLVFFLTPPR
jgi:uncharacterized protein YbcI